MHAWQTVLGPHPPATDPPPEVRTAAETTPRTRGLATPTGQLNDYTLPDNASDNEGSLDLSTGKLVVVANPLEYTGNLQTTYGQSTVTENARSGTGQQATAGLLKITSNDQGSSNTLLSKDN